MDFSKCPMDGAPFQLVDTTSIYKAHTLFGLLSLSHAYITEVGMCGVANGNKLDGRLKYVELYRWILLVMVHL